MSLDDVEGSPSLEMVNLVLQKQAAGEHIVSLAIGEPSFNTPAEIVDVAYRAMQAGEVHYTSSYGTAEVRDAIRTKVSRKNRIEADVSNTIFLTTKLAVFAALVAVVRKSSEVLIPDPGYFYREPVILSGATPRYYGLNGDLSLDADLVGKQINERTRAVIINTPSNPTGRVYDKEELGRLYDVCRKRGVYIISDEAYEDLVYVKEHSSIGSLEDAPELVISLFSLSKSYAMTGWRAGYAVGSAEMVSRIAKFIEHTYTSYPPFIQKASAHALLNCDHVVEQFVQELASRKKLAEGRLESISGIEPYTAEGAFYLFPSYKPDVSSQELSKKILQEQGVALLPGIAFGPHGERRLRVSFSGPTESLTEGMDRLGAFFSGL